MNFALTRQTIFFASAILAYLSIRLVHLTSGTIWLDEGYSLFFSQIPLLDIFSKASLDANPPFGNALYHVWTGIFGLGEFTVRVPGLLGSVLSFVLFIKVAERLVKQPAALYAALLYSLSALEIDYAQQIRIYPLAMAGLLSCIWFLLRWRENGETRFFVAGLAAALVTMHLHYFTWIVIPWIVLYFLSRARKNRSIRREIIAVAIAVLAMSPAASVLLGQYTEHRSFVWIPKPSKAMFLLIGLRLSADSLPLMAIFPALLFTLFFLPPRGTAVTVARSRKEEVAFLLVWSLMPLLTALLVSLAAPSFFHARYFYFCLPAVLLLVALALTAFPVRAAVPILVVMLGCMGYSAYRYFELRDSSGNLRDALSSLNPETGDIILHTSKCSYVPAVYYHRYSFAEYLIEGGGDSNVFRYRDRSETFRSLPELKDANRVWVVSIPCAPDHGFRELARHPDFVRLGFELERRHLDDTIILYRRRAEAQ